MKKTLWLLLSCFALSLGACDADTDSGGELTVQAADGAALHFELSTPPLVEGQNDLGLEILDGDVPLEGATVTVLATMPGMGHDGSGTPATDQGSGGYTVEGLVFSMPGSWEIEVSATSEGVSDSVTFTVEVQ